MLISQSNYILKQGPQNTLRALFQLYVSRSSASSEKLSRFSIDLNCKPVLKEQFLHISANPEV